MMTESLKAVNWALTKQQGKVLKTEQLLAEVEATASEDLAKGGSLRKADELGTILKQENLKLSQIQEALTGMQGLESTLKGAEGEIVHSDGCLSDVRTIQNFTRFISVENMPLCSQSEKEKKQQHSHKFSICINFIV